MIEELAKTIAQEAAEKMNHGTVESEVYDVCLKMGRAVAEKLRAEHHKECLEMERDFREELRERR